MMSIVRLLCKLLTCGLGSHGGLEGAGAWGDSGCV